MGYEYLIVTLAAALAGIGTGLVGLSAATAMVPLMIVLCPTFQGEHGAYMATAIALASDILGSAVTTGVYAKNKNIDLKHGWLLTVCIISMCSVGSIAAYFTHQQVLGGFSLFLCVAIGIRFLVKPDSKDKRESSSTVKLSGKEIAVSLFFGLTIGFGTGFFGSGGGMMMLIVFTAMLGYDRKTAVGTSTFIMTFTALALCTDQWLAAVLSEIVFLLVIIAALHIFEHFPFYSALFVEKRKHEVLTSFILLFSLMTVLLAVFWGGFGEGHKYIAVAAIMAWGPGDAMAAIIGKNHGKHKLRGKHIEGTKSVEGSVAMAVTSFLCTLPVLLTMSGLPWYIALLFAAVTAPIASLTELFTMRGFDTVTVPIITSLFLCLSMLWR